MSATRKPPPPPKTVPADAFRVTKRRAEPDAPPDYRLSVRRSGETRVLIVTTRAAAMRLYFELVAALDLMPETPDPTFPDPGPRRPPR